MTNFKPVASLRPNGPVDQFGRDFKAYLNDNPDESRRFALAWSEGDAQVLMHVVQRFFDGLPDFQPIDTGVRREDNGSFSYTSIFQSESHRASAILHPRH